MLKLFVGCSNSKLTLMKPGRLDCWFAIPLLEKSRLLTTGRFDMVYYLEPEVMPNEFFELTVPAVCYIMRRLALAF